MTKSDTLNAALVAAITPIAESKSDFIRLKQDLRWGFAHYLRGQPHSPVFEKLLLPQLQTCKTVAEQHVVYTETQAEITRLRAEIVKINQATRATNKKKYNRNYARSRRNARWPEPVRQLAAKLVDAVKARGNKVSPHAVMVIADAILNRPPATPTTAVPTHPHPDK